MTDGRIAITTVASAAEAERIAQALVEGKLAACVQIIGPIQSIFRWQGAVEKAQEWLLMMKTVTARLPELESKLAALHPYQVPEFVVLEVEHAGAAYLDWLRTGVLIC